MNRNDEGITRCISVNKRIRIEALDGSLTICNASKTFPSQPDPDFFVWNLNKPGPPTPITDFKINEVLGEGMLLDFFISVNADLEKLVTTQHQIARFCQMYQGALNEHLATNFFLTKDWCHQENAGLEKYFVVGVTIRFDGLSALIYRLNHPQSWIYTEGSHHFVITPKN